VLELAEANFHPQSPGRCTQFLKHYITKHTAGFQGYISLSFEKNSIILWKQQKSFTV